MCNIFKTFVCLCGISGLPCAHRLQVLPAPTSPTSPRYHLVADRSPIIFLGLPIPTKSSSVLLYHCRTRRPRCPLAVRTVLWTLCCPSQAEVADSISVEDRACPSLVSNPTKGNLHNNGYSTSPCRTQSTKTSRFRAAAASLQTLAQIRNVA